MTANSGGPLAQLKEVAMSAMVEVSEIQGPLTELLQQIGGKNGRLRFQQFKLWLKIEPIVAAIINGETELWSHPNQQDQFVQGRRILRYLNNNNLLASCADRDDLEDIRSQGVAFFRKHFEGKKVFAWKGARGEHVPYLVENDGRLNLLWVSLEHHWIESSLALRMK